MESFGWHVLTADGHDMDGLITAVHQAQLIKNKPIMIIAKTVKGKGLSFAENQVEWHAKGFSEEEHSAALRELK